MAIVIQAVARLRGCGVSAVKDCGCGGFSIGVRRNQQGQGGREFVRTTRSI